MKNNLTIWSLCARPQKFHFLFKKVLPRFECSSVTRLGYFWKFKVSSFSCKRSPNIWNILGYFEKSTFLSKTSGGYFLFQYPVTLVTRNRRRKKFSTNLHQNQNQKRVRSLPIHVHSLWWIFLLTHSSGKRHDQCDKMARLFFIICLLSMHQICPKFIISRFKILSNTD